MKKKKEEPRSSRLAIWIAGTLLATAIVVQTQFPPNQASAKYETTPITSSVCYCAGDKDGHFHW